MHGSRASSSTPVNQSVKRMRSSADGIDDVLLSPDDKVASSGQVFPAPELKYYDTYLPQTIISQDGSLADGIISVHSGFGDVACPVRGDNPQERNGNHIIITSWQIKFVLDLAAISNGTAPPTGRTVFIALVRDKQTNNTQCTAAQIYTSMQTGDPVFLACLLRNPLFGDRFEVLRSGLFDLNPASCNVWSEVTPDCTANPGRQVCVEYFVPLSVPVTFSSNSAGPPPYAAQDNTLHVVAFCTPSLEDAELEIAPPVYMRYQSRVRFLSHV